MPSERPKAPAEVEAKVVPRFPFVLVDVSADEADLMSSTLFELGAEGVEERDLTTLVKGRQADKVTLVASFSERALAEAAVAALEKESNPGALPCIEEVVGDAWRDAWKEHYRPFAICKGVVVRPPWEAYAAAPGETVVELEPGRAFGTGLHETTSLVAAALEERRALFQHQPVLDVGTGSGILAILALVLGAKEAVATDNDPDVLSVVVENAERNHLGDRIRTTTDDVAALSGTFPFVVANIEARVLIPMADDLMRKVAPKGILILSGILAPQEDDVRRAYSALTHLQTHAKGEWIALAFERSAA